MMRFMEALILAAGLGERMGGSKVRLLVGGTPLVLLHARRAREAGCTRVVAVVRAEDEAWVSREMDTVVSNAPDPAGSLALGVGALRDALVLFVPVDTLPASPVTIAALVQALGPEEPDLLAASPVHEGRGGHPVLLRSSVLDPYRAEGAAPPLRDVLGALGARRTRVVVDDPLIAHDLNYPADVFALTRVTPTFFIP
jgi:molybdenum cofactor cytidylyltransferase